MIAYGGHGESVRVGDDGGLRMARSQQEREKKNE
jgi:hypothetical protein